MPVPAATPASAFCAGFAMREAVAADYDCYQTCNLRDRPGEEALDGVEAGVERTSLGMGSEWGQDENTEHYQRWLSRG